MTGDEQDPEGGANWYSDPQGRYEGRYWTGSTWTRWVIEDGRVVQDPQVEGAARSHAIPHQHSAGIHWPLRLAAASYVALVLFISVARAVSPGDGATSAIATAEAFANSLCSGDVASALTYVDEHGAFFDDLTALGDPPLEDLGDEIEAECSDISAEIATIGASRALVDITREFEGDADSSRFSMVERDGRWFIEEPVGYGLEDFQ